MDPMGGMVRLTDEILDLETFGLIPDEDLISDEYMSSPEP